MPKMGPQPLQSLSNVHVILCLKCQCFVMLSYTHQTKFHQALIAVLMVDIISFFHWRPKAILCLRPAHRIFTKVITHQKKYKIYAGTN